MLLTLFALPKLAVSAKFLCLLMVVMCGSVPSHTERTVRLYNKCSNSYVRVEPNGLVRADQHPSEKYQNLKLISTYFNEPLFIYAVDAQLYLCFNKKWGLIGAKNASKHHCRFYEDMTDARYFRYISTHEPVYIGFNRKGRPLRNQTTSKLQRLDRQGCYDFMKIDTMFSVVKHNIIKGGGTWPQRYSTSSPVLGEHKNKHKRHRNKQNNTKLASTVSQNDSTSSPVPGEPQHKHRRHENKHHHKRRPMP